MKRRPGIMCAAGLASILVTAACRNTPQPFAPPVQRPLFADFRPYRIRAVIDMADEDAKSHFVEGITSVAAPTWRWTAKRPTVRVRTRSAEHLRYTIDFEIAESAFAVTGPLTITFLVNNRVLDRVRYDRPGGQHFEKLLPEGWVTANQDVTVGAEIDKLWVSPVDGAMLGIVLLRMGLLQ